MRFFSLAALVAVASAAAAARPSTLVHTVLFEFKPDADPAAVRAATARFLALKEKCVRPGTDVRYMLSMKGGSDNSPEGLQEGLNHGFVSEFCSEEDRDYYVFEDPHHQAFKASIKDLVIKTVVVDFLDGVY